MESTRKVSSIQYRNTADLTVSDKYDDLFGSNQTVLNYLIEDMKENGFDEAHPIIVTMIDGKLTVVDGHTRFKASQTVGIKSIPVFNKVFQSHDERLEYMASTQRNKRKLADYHIYNYILRTYSERGLTYKGESYKKRVARALGISKEKVYQVMKIIEHAKEYPESKITVKFEKNLNSIKNKLEPVSKKKESTSTSSQKKTVKEPYESVDSRPFISRYYNQITSKRKLDILKEKATRNKSDIVEFDSEVLQKTLDANGTAVYDNVHLNFNVKVVELLTYLKNSTDVEVKILVEKTSVENGEEA